MFCLIYIYTPRYHLFTTLLATTLRYLVLCGILRYYFGTMVSFFFARSLYPQFHQGSLSEDYPVFLSLQRRI